VIRPLSPRSLAVTLVALVAASSATAQTGACRIPGFPAPELCARARLDTVKASFLIIVDTSGSMRPLWGSMREALAEFASAIPDGDDLTVRLFAGGVGTYVPPVPLGHATRSSVMSRLRALPVPSGANTDLGAAAQSGLEALRSAPTDRLFFLFFLTDGRHDPPSLGKYGTTWDAQWGQLATEAATLLGARRASVAIVRLTASADNTMLTRVFPGAVITDAIGQDALRGWFRATSRTLAVTKLRQLLDRELRKPAFALASKGPVSLQSDHSKVVALALASARGIVGYSIEDTSAHPLPAGGAIRFGALRVVRPTDAPSETQVTLENRRQPWWLPPGSRRRTIDTTVSLAMRLEPAEELAKIGVSPVQPETPVRLQLQLAGGGALPMAGYVPLALGLVLLTALLMVRAKWAMHRPRLSGRVLVIQKNGDSVQHDLKGKRTPYPVKADGVDLLQIKAESTRGKTRIYAVPTPGVDLSSKDEKVLGPVLLDRDWLFTSDTHTFNFATARQPPLR